MKKEKDFSEANWTEFVSSAWERNISGEGEDDNREELSFQRALNQKDKSRTVCRSCTYEEDQGGYDKKKQLVRGVSRGVDLKGLMILCWCWGWCSGGA